MVEGEMCLLEQQHEDLGAGDGADQSIEPVLVLKTIDIPSSPQPPSSSCSSLMMVESARGFFNGELLGGGGVGLEETLSQG